METKYLIAMKSGKSFYIYIRDFQKFLETLQEIVNRDASTNLYADGGVLFDINDISMICPTSHVLEE